MSGWGLKPEGSAGANGPLAQALPASEWRSRAATLTTFFQQNLKSFRLILAAELVLTVLLAWLASVLIWCLIAPGSLAPAASAAPEARMAAITSSSSDPVILLRFDPFNRQTADVSTPRQTASAPRTSLDLKLYGVRTAADNEVLSAIIGRSDGKQVLVQVGDEIEQGVRLTEVRPDRVIISRRGVKESLTFPAARKPTGIRSNAPQPTAAPAPAPAPAAGPISVETFGDFAEAFKIEPAMDGGQFKGVRLVPRRQGYLEQFGLQGGDIVTRIEDTPLRPGIDLAGLIESLEGLERIRLFVERGGSEAQLNLDFQS